jgi:arginine N-succinyltransferase
VHHDTEPALALLLAEGFASTNEVDIFDAGPLVRGQTDQLRTVRLTRTAKVRTAIAPSSAEAPRWLLANGALDFRATLGDVIEHDDGTVALAAATARALNLDVGDKLWFAPLR